jgi:hypothetical protein
LLLKVWHRPSVPSRNLKILSIGIDGLISKISLPIIPRLMSDFFWVLDEDESEGRFFGLNPWTAIITMAILGVGGLKLKRN